MPTALRLAARRLRALLAPAAAERELDDELRFHVELETEHNVRQGMAPDVARQTALREMGDLARWRREAGVAGRGSLADAVGRDLRVGLRALRRTPAFTAVAVLTLALAIGVTTAVFSAIDGVLLRPLPYPQPDRLVRLYERTDASDRAAFTSPNVLDVREQSRTLRGVAHYRVGETTLLGADEPVRADSDARQLAGLRLAFKPEGGTVTAGNAPGITDGAAALVVMSARRARELGIAPLARIAGYAQAAVQPLALFDAPPAAIKRLLERTGTTLDDYDLWEINEAFAAQILANGQVLGLDWDRVNVNGGAIALGHPIGASGARVLVTLLHALQARGGGRGIASLCLGGGEAVALSVEMLSAPSEV